MFRLSLLTLVRNISPIQQPGVMKSLRIGRSPSMTIVVLISQATTKDLSTDVVSYASSPYQSLMRGVATNNKTIGAESSDDEEISYEEMVHSY